MYPENDWRNYLIHSLKGQRWARHKYLYITPSGRYVYPKDTAYKTKPSITRRQGISSGQTMTNGQWKKWRVMNDTSTKIQPVAKQYASKKYDEGLLKLSKILEEDKKKKKRSSKRPNGSRKKRTLNEIVPVDWYT